MDEPESYDFIVIGGGSGGSASARRAAGWYGAKTLLIDSGRAGGTYVNAGCVPKKMTWNWSNFKAMFRVAKGYGHEVPGTPAQSSKGQWDSIIGRLNEAMEANWARDGITRVRGHARLAQANTILVEQDGGRGQALFTAPQILIATGGRPILPDIPGAEHGITSGGFFQLEGLRYPLSALLDAAQTSRNICILQLSY